MMIVFLLGWILFSLTQHSREGATFVQTPPDCMTLAQQNEANLAALTEKVKSLGNLSEKVATLQNNSKSNQQQLSVLVDNLHKSKTK